MKRIIFTLCLAISSVAMVIAQDSLVIFHDSADPRFHDQSVVTQTAPSTVVAEPFTAGGANPDKLPVVTDPVKGGTNALKLQWNSMEGGNWTVLVASVGWTLFDVTNMTHLKFWVNSPAALDTASMPLIYLEANAGTPKVTGTLRLADYATTGLTANMWTEVAIPLADFWAADMTFTAKDVIKGVFFIQNAAGTMEHTLYLDQFSFHQTTGIDKLYENKQLNVYFSKGEIRFGNYSGPVQVFDLIGRKVAEGDAINKSFKVNLESGIYIISTNEGSKKLVLK